MENRGRVAVFAAVLAMAGRPRCWWGAGRRAASSTRGAIPVPRSLAADNASNPHAKVAVAPKRVPARVPSGAYHLLAAPAATPVALPARGPRSRRW